MSVGCRGKAGDEHRVEATRGLAFRHHAIHGFDIAKRELRIDGANDSAQWISHLLGWKLGAKHNRARVAGAKCCGCE